MKIVIISDTHGKHHEVTQDLPEGDVIIHAGDISRGRGSISGTDDFLKWYMDLPYKHKILIAGNHDLPLEDEFLCGEDYVEYYTSNGVIYLNDSGVEIKGIKIWGSPMSPSFGYGWAFNRDRGEDIQKHWDKIPDNTNVLITHTPPYGIGDKLIPQHIRYKDEDPHVGCKNLLSTIDARLHNLKIHASGHIHEAYGVRGVGGVDYVNASLLNEDYIYTNKPIMIEL